jgi:cysteine-rich repeat protein
LGRISSAGSPITSWSDPNGTVLLQLTSTWSEQVESFSESDSIIFCLTSLSNGTYYLYQVNTSDGVVLGKSSALLATFYGELSSIYAWNRISITLLGGSSTFDTSLSGADIIGTPSSSESVAFLPEIQSSIISFDSSTASVYAGAQTSLPDSNGLTYLISAVDSATGQINYAYGTAGLVSGNYCDPFEPLDSCSLKALLIGHNSSYVLFEYESATFVSVLLEKRFSNGSADSTFGVKSVFNDTIPVRSPRARILRSGSILVVGIAGDWTGLWITLLGPAGAPLSQERFVSLSLPDANGPSSIGEIIETSNGTVFVIGAWDFGSSSITSRGFILQLDTLATPIRFLQPGASPVFQDYTFDAGLAVPGLDGVLFVAGWARVGSSPRLIAISRISTAMGDLDSSWFSNGSFVLSDHAAGAGSISKLLFDDSTSKIVAVGSSSQRLTHSRVTIIRIDPISGRLDCLGANGLFRGSVSVAGVTDAIMIGGSCIVSSGSRTTMKLEKYALDGAAVCGCTCGNSFVENGETCDDGNLVDGDGCSSSCQIESGWTCPFSGTNCILG